MKYPTTKEVSFLDPAKTGNVKDSEHCLQKTLEILVSHENIAASVAQNCEREAKNLIQDEVTKVALQSYKRLDTRLDEFWMSLLHTKPGGKKVCQIILTLSHGNADLERSFSVNGELLVENLKEESLIALRQVFYHVSKEGR